MEQKRETNLLMSRTQMGNLVLKMRGMRSSVQPCYRPLASSRNRHSFIDVLSSNPFITYQRWLQTVQVFALIVQIGHASNTMWMTSLVGGHPEGNCFVTVTWGTDWVNSVREATRHAETEDLHRCNWCWWTFWHRLVLEVPTRNH